MNKSLLFSFLTIIIALLVFHENSINSFPSKIHAWSQSDRYALAIGFTKNGLDLFHPQTLNLTESPDHKLIPKETSITAIDFPITDYFAALIMKLFGTNAPWCFRLITFFYSILGLFFLFLLSKKITENKGVSLFIVLFSATSPVYLYYQIGFLPSIPAISNLFIGLYFYLVYEGNKKIRHLSLGLFFLTLAVLIRKPFLIFLLAVAIYEGYKALKTRAINQRLLLVFVISLLVIVGYNLYNKHLEHLYGSAFLGSLLPPNNISHAVEITITVCKNWFFQYFTFVHYLFLVFIILLIVFLVIKGVALKERVNKPLLSIVLLSLLGSSLYYFVMMRQYPDHDYYFLDSFYPVICLLLVGLIGTLPINQKYSKHIGVLSLCFFIILLFTLNLKIQQKREEIGFWDRVEITKNNFLDSGKLLNENGIPTDAKILVIESYTANAPFILMNRFGYAMMSKKPEDIQKALTWNYDYVVMQDCFTLSDVVRSYPPILNDLQRIAGNGKISIYCKKKNLQGQNLLAFVGLESQTPVFKSVIDFDSPVDSCWHGVVAKTIPGSKYQKSGVLTDSLAFSTTFSLKNFKPLTQRQLVLTVDLDIYTKELLNGARIAASIEDLGKSQYFNAYELSDFVDTLSKWTKVHFVFPILPQLKGTENELKVYIWNDGKHRFLYDNFNIEIY